jgi:hypothetical protein
MDRKKEFDRGYWRMTQITQIVVVTPVVTISGGGMGGRLNERIEPWI